MRSGMKEAVMLRPVVEADYVALGRLRADIELQHLLLSNPPPGGNMDVLGWLQRRKELGMIWTISDASDDTCVGYAQLSSIHHINRHAHIGIVFLPEKRGIGYGEQAMMALLCRAASLGLHKLILEVRVDNIRAINLYEKLSFCRVGTLRQHYYDGDHLHDVLIMERKVSVGSCV